MDVGGCAAGEGLRGRPGRTHRGRFIMTVTKGTICDLEGKPLVKNAHVEIDEEPGVSVWGGHFRLPQPAPPMDLFRPRCLVKLQDGRVGTVTIGRCDRHAAYFLGNGKLEVPAAAAPAVDKPAA
jgi:hypothetical protein